jgi:hypothetical protein
MRRQRGALVAALVLLVSVAADASAQQRAHYRKTHDGYLLPDPNKSAGVVAHYDKATICNMQWSKGARFVTAKMKSDAYELYRAKKSAKVSCEVDHLVSRDVGGADDPSNLWPSRGSRPGSRTGWRPRRRIKSATRVPT